MYVLLFYFRFFKNRNWLFTEFPELAPHLSENFPKNISKSISAEAGSSTNSLPQNSCIESSSTEQIQGNVIEQRSSVDCGPVPEPQHTCQTQSTSPPDTADSIYPGCGATCRVLEVGCGVGNTIFPLLQTNNDPNLFVYGGDFSSTAINIIKEHQEYDTNRYRLFIVLYSRVIMIKIDEYHCS